MFDLVKYSYKLSTLSSIVLSPRAQTGFYYNIDYDETSLGDNLPKDKIPKLIYPFYQYGSYEKYNPKKARYYIPGSSIKGAMEQKGELKFLVDDIRVVNQDIRWQTLQKVQYIPKKGIIDEKRKAMKIDTFFPNTVVEYLVADKVYSSDCWLPKEFMYEIENIKNRTEIKLQRAMDIIEKILREKEFPKGSDSYKAEKECRGLLKEMKNNISNLYYESNGSKEREFFLFLGGYKGLALAQPFDINEIGESSIYIDLEKKLPYGLVKLSIESARI